MKLVSSAFADGAAIPRRFACDGENTSPPLLMVRCTRWNAELRCCSATIPIHRPGTWHHWTAYDIPTTATELAEEAARNAEMKQAVNDFGETGFGGPCPPHGHGPHHYHFRPLALSTDQLWARPNASCRDVEREARKFTLAEALLVGWYER